MNEVTVTYLPSNDPEAHAIDLVWQVLNNSQLALSPQGRSRVAEFIQKRAYENQWSTMSPVAGLANNAANSATLRPPFATEAAELNEKTSK